MYASDFALKKEKANTDALRQFLTLYACSVAPFRIA